MAEEYWAGFRPQPQKVEGDLVTIELTVESPLEHGEAFARVTTPSGVGLWATEVRKVDARPGGRIEIVLWDGLVAEGAFAQINLGKAVNFTLDAFGLIELAFAATKAGTAIKLKCTKIVSADALEKFEQNVSRLLAAIAAN